MKILLPTVDIKYLRLSDVSTPNSEDLIFMIDEKETKNLDRQVEEETKSNTI